MSLTIRCLLLLALGIEAALLGGCVAGSGMGVTPPEGFIYTHYRAPMRCSLEESGGVPCERDSKTGTSSVHGFMVWYPSTTPPFLHRLLVAEWGDTALDDAARSAGITTIYYADYELLEVLGIYKRATVHVYGK
jgi:hypothetical protein